MVVLAASWSPPRSLRAGLQGGDDGSHHDVDLQGPGGEHAGDHEPEQAADRRGDPRPGQAERHPGSGRRECQQQELSGAGRRHGPG
jgi:hypothetical protein